MVVLLFQLSVMINSEIITEGKYKEVMEILHVWEEKHFENIKIKV